MLISADDDVLLVESGDILAGAGTRLFGLAPLGAGTSARESLRGYVVRLALEHSVLPRELVSKVLADIEPAIAALNYARFYARHAVTVDGLGAYARLFVRALQSGTGRRDLAQHTLLPLSALLAPNGQRLMTGAPRWCPECLAVDTTGYRGGHWQLRWTLDALGHCSVHGHALVERCWQCHRAQPVIPRKPSLWHCDHCGASLSRRPEANEKSVLPSSVEIIDDLIAFSGRRVDDLGRAWRAGIERVLPATDDGTRSALCRSLGLQPRAFNAWINKGQKVSMDLLVRVCEGLSALPSEVLLGERRDLSGRTPSSKDAGSRRSHPRQTRLLAESLLRAALLAQSLPTLREVSSQTGVSRSYLRYWFPELCDELAGRRSLVLGEARAQRRRWQAEVISQIISAYWEAGVFPGRKLVEAAVRRAGFSLLDRGAMMAYRQALITAMISGKTASEVG